jgi:hypothetical protein
VAALRELGYEVAQGRRLVVIDREGQPHALFRQIEGVKSADVKKHLEGISFRTLKDRSDEDSGARERARTARQQQRVKASATKPAEYFDRDQQQRDSDERIIDAGIRHGEAEARDEVRGQKRSDLLRLLQDRHFEERGQLSDRHSLAKLGLDGRLEAQYGPKARALAAQIEGLEHTLQGRFVLGRASKTHALEQARKSAADIQQRREEARGTLDLQIARERQAFEERAEYERLIVESGFPPRASARDRAARLRASTAPRASD